MLEELNLKLFSLINASQATASWKISGAELAADYFIYLIPVLLVLCWLLGQSRQRPALFFATVVTFFALGVNQLIGLAWFHPRPAMLGLGHTFFAHAPDSSFPSDHMTVFWAIGFSLFCHAATRTIGLGTMTAGLVVAWARIYLGVHFPMDMLGAAVISSLSFALLLPIQPWLVKTFLLPLENAYRILFATPIAQGWVQK